MRIARFYGLLAPVLLAAPTCVMQQQTGAQENKQQQKIENLRESFEPRELWMFGPEGAKAARNVANIVETLAAQSRWEEARKVIPDAKEFCGSFGLGYGACDTIIASTRGYLDLKQSESLPAQSTGALQLLKDAAKAYSEAAEWSPSNGPVLSNLATVYLRLGEFGDARFSLEKAILADPGRSASYASMLGELELQSGHWGTAIEGYSRAAQAAPDSYLPRRRLVEIYLSHYDGLTAAERHRFVGLLGDWEVAVPDLARAGYEFLLIRERSDGGDGEQAFLSWTRLLAREGDLTEGSVREFRDYQTNLRLSALGAFLDRPWRMPDSGSWWLGRQERRIALADISLSWGRTHQGQLSPELVEQCWQTGVKLLPPGAEQGELSQIPEALQVALDLRQELVVLYGRQPLLDPGGGKAKQLVGELFAEKMIMITRGDLESQQRYHTTLGQIFAAKGTWSSDDAANALYQLSHAIAVAQRRYQEGVTQGFYQPLPELRALMAEGYHQNSMADAAAHAAVSTALAYFDADDLEKAGKWTARAQEYHVPDKTIAPLRELLQLRRASAEESQAGGTLQISESKQPWLYLKNDLVGDDFLKRQRFKLLADISRPSPKEVDWQWSPGPAVEAYSLVVQGEGIPLMGAADLERWKRVKAILFNALGGETSPTQTIPVSHSNDLASNLGQTHEPLKDHIVYLTLPGELQPEGIAVTTADVTIANVTRTFGAERFGLYYRFLRLNANQLFISPEAPLATISPLLDQLRIEGIRVELTTEGVAWNLHSGMDPHITLESAGARLQNRRMGF
jgi:tetratricopeptide (TPR) repeat protein